MIINAGGRLESNVTKKEGSDKKTKKKYGVEIFIGQVT
jgi:hypothetical protein